MKEFLIRREDKDFCILHASKFKDVMHPSSIKSEPIEGWGDYRIKIADSEISFSFEMVGIQISFENADVDNREAEIIVSEVCQSVENEIKTPCHWIQLSE